MFDIAANEINVALHSGIYKVSFNQLITFPSDSNETFKLSFPIAYIDPLAVKIGVGSIGVILMNQFLLFEIWHVCLQLAQVRVIRALAITITIKLLLLERRVFDNLCVY